MSEENEPSKTTERSKTAEHFCTTYLKQASTSLEWTILNFNLLEINSNSLESSSFESVKDDVHTGTWKLKLFPKFRNEDKVGLFFACSENLDNIFVVKCEACIIDAEGKDANKKELSAQLTSKEIGFVEFITKENLVESLLPNGNLTIRCSVTVICRNQTQFKRSINEKVSYDCSLRQDFSKLLKEETLSDAVLLCDGRKFPVHKCVLSARSSVFSEMFHYKLTEEQGNVEVTDIEPDILQSLIYYIYTDKLPDFSTAKISIQLLQCAHAYNLQGLKKNCEDYLKNAVSIPYFYEIAVAAEVHSLESLKEVCVDFLCVHLKKIMSFEFNKDLFSIAPQYILSGLLKHHFMKRSEFSQMTSLLASTSVGFDTLPRRIAKAKRKVYALESIDGMGK